MDQGYWWGCSYIEQVSQDAQWRTVRNPEESWPIERSTIPITQHLESDLDQLIPQSGSRTSFSSDSMEPMGISIWAAAASHMNWVSKTRFYVLHVIWGKEVICEIFRSKLTVSIKRIVGVKSWLDELEQPWWETTFGLSETPRMSYINLHCLVSGFRH